MRELIGGECSARRDRSVRQASLVSSQALTLPNDATLSDVLSITLHLSVGRTQVAAPRPRKALDLAARSRVRAPRRGTDVDEELHARRSGTPTSSERHAAQVGASRMSSGSRSGYARRISSMAAPRAESPHDRADRHRQTTEARLPAQDRGTNVMRASSFVLADDPSAPNDRRALTASRPARRARAPSRTRALARSPRRRGA